MKRFQGSPLAKISSFAVVLLAVFAAATLAGSAIDPEVEETSGHGADSASHGGGDEGHSAGHAGPAAPGLAVSDGEYRLVPRRSMLSASRGAGYSFEIVGPDGEAVTEFDTLHAKDMHLIAVRRDLTNFQHVHPTMDTDGTWSARLDSRQPGAYRVFADFSADGEQHTLGTDLEVPGRTGFASLPAPATSDTTEAGYRVTLETDASSAGEEGPVAFEITRGGEPVEVEPYLGADGHLVTLREHDLAYLHTHPLEEPDGVGPVEFELAYPSAGNYRLFFQFKHEGEVHTAEFTREVTDGNH